MRYLATVESKSLWGKQLLRLHCKEVDKFTWLPVQEEISLTLEHKFLPGMLVMAHITVANRLLQRVEEATQSIVATLNGFSTSSRQHKDLSRDIEAWKESMHFQLGELRRREEDLMRRAEELQLDLTCSVADSGKGVTIPQSLEEYKATDAEAVATQS